MVGSSGLCDSNTMTGINPYFFGHKITHLTTIILCVVIQHNFKLLFFLKEKGGLANFPQYTPFKTVFIPDKSIITIAI
jgi:hypothetical protein